MKVGFTWEVWVALGVAAVIAVGERAEWSLLNPAVVASAPTATPLIVTVEVTRLVPVTVEPIATLEPPAIELTNLSIPEPAARGERGGWTDGDVRDALRDAPLLVQRIVYCEVGQSGVYDPYAVGSLGELGPAQLLPGRGNGLEIFERWGFDDPHSPYQAVSFIKRVIAEGMIGSQYPRTSLGCAGSV